MSLLRLSHANEAESLSLCPADSCEAANQPPIIATNCYSPSRQDSRSPLSFRLQLGGWGWGTGWIVVQYFTIAKVLIASIVNNMREEWLR